LHRQVITSNPVAKCTIVGKTYIRLLAIETSAAKNKMASSVGEKAMLPTEHKLSYLLP